MRSAWRGVTTTPKRSAPSHLPAKRLLKLKEMFYSKFGSIPKFYVRAPGRVNLIGEHIDYCGYSVLPMAVEQDMLIAAEPVKTHTIQLANTNPLYPDFSTSVNNIQIDKTKPLWHNYFLCGFKGIQEHFGLSNLTGMNCLVDGNIPPSSGLSSSSALVCCAGLVTLTALGMNLSKVELAEICAKSERYIGTEGGGMDQSISFLAEEGTAKLIEFSPLRATNVKLPSGAVFVIANSCVEMNKAATSHFNIRVMECRLAAKLLAKNKGLLWGEVLRLEEVQAKLGVSLEEMLLVIEDALHPEPYNPEEICSCLGISLEKLRTQILSPNTQDEILELSLSHPRCCFFRQHVFDQGTSALTLSPSPSSPADLLPFSNLEDQEWKRGANRSAHLQTLPAGKACVQ
ncbi:N-acetylgalactosamine kinase isoform X6 [Choloepus didactylus]|uniref:N-acetylgalactosamine kinase isoform X6 n=1 Tax=Choloepus didactylus TaxID=27675 RepID=UPI00189D1739|nr:N-acetylgalactosamine kinase isoform X6 [Choloepus didactylus]